MSNSDSQLLRVIDQVVRSNKDRARRRTISDSKELVNVHLELEQAGHKNTDFMYEFDEHGKPTGYFKQDRRYKDYYAAQEAHQSKLIKEFGTSNYTATVAIQANMRKWVSENSDLIDGYVVPKAHL